MQLLDKQYDQKKYLDFLRGMFDLSEFLKPIDTINEDVESFEQLGFITTADEKELPVFEIHIKPDTKLERNRVGLRNLVAKEVGTNDGALAVYVDDENNLWRFSFIAIEHIFGEDGVKTEETSSKRFTYLLGEGTKIRTATERFDQLNQRSTLDDLKAAFAVEALSKEFYGKLYRWYETAQTQVTFPNDEQANNHTQTSLIRLLTRLLFVWFIKEKKLINPDLFELAKLKNIIDWKKGSSFYKAILQNLFFATLNVEIKSRHFRNTKLFQGKNKDYGNQYRYRYYDLVKKVTTWENAFKQTSFLNGGLFECLDIKLCENILDGNNKPIKDEAGNKIINQQHKKLLDQWTADIRPEKYMIRMDGFSDNPKNKLEFDNTLFFNTEADLGLIDLFNQYQFTVEESTPTDVEVALDPELLGKVFENLLASYNPETGQQARKDTGSFYTPREIVSYMVDESLKQYFKTHINLGKATINNLFIEGENKLKEAEIKAAIKAIDGLKILDPAVGSGAFPMGILQRLVFILEKIDPENKHFKQQQLDKTQTMEEASKKASIDAIEQIFSQENQHNAYGKKLMLIENCIYGVDIQPIAIQICKLRFFISLTIEQESNKNSANSNSPNNNINDNYGIKALPNLETKFIVANTLLPLGEMPSTGQMGLFDTGITKLQQNLAEVRHQYFSAKTLQTKRKYRDKDKDLREKMLVTLTQSGISPAVEATMKQVVNWDLYNQNSKSDWFDPEWMFGIKDGFDIVLGNPPYIMEDDNKNAFDNLHSHPCYQGKTDIWHLFVGSGLDFAQEKGIVTYIAKNQWFCSSSASKMRKVIYKNAHLKKIIDFGGNLIFENAGQQTMIFLMQKTLDNKKHYVKYMKFNSAISIKDIKQVISKNLESLEKLFVSNKILPKNYNEMENLTFSSSEKELILNKINNKRNFEFNPKTEIIQGLIGGPDKAFVIKAGELVNFTKEESTFLKMLHTKTARFFTPDTDKYIFYISKKNFDGKNIDSYPNIKNQLLDYKEKLENRREVLKGSIKWFHLWWARDEKFFKEGSKIIFTSRTEGKCFSYTEKSFYGSRNLFFIKSERVNLKYITAFLNSNLMYFYMDERLKHTGDLLQIDKNQFMKIPLFIPDDTINYQSIVDKIITAKKAGKNTSNLEAKIDKLVYQLYQLTAAEIKIVEASE